MASPRLSGQAYKPNRGLFDLYYRPKIQPCYKYNGVWSEVTIPLATKESRKFPSVMRLLTGNIDVLSGGGDIRMHAALNLLKQEFDDNAISVPIVLCFKR